MKALLYQGPRDIRYESFDDPSLAADTDAIIKMDKCGICGSDLHIYHGEGFSPDLGFCVGHEAVGEVVELGRSARRLKVGDKVMLSAAVGCGSCVNCSRATSIIASPAAQAATASATASKVVRPKAFACLWLISTRTRFPKASPPIRR